MWAWMYQSWLQDKEEEYDKFKNFSIFIGSFSNPQMAQSIAKRDKPDYESDEKDVEKSVENIQKIDEFLEKVPERRRRRKINR